MATEQETPLEFSETVDQDWGALYPDAWQRGHDSAIKHDGQTWRVGAANPYIGGTGNWYAYNIGWNSVTREME